MNTTNAIYAPGSKPSADIIVDAFYRAQAVWFGADAALFHGGGGETVSQSPAKLDAAVSACLWHGHASLKVIHGHGSGGGVSRIKPQVLAALRKHAARLGAVMEQDGDNPGAHVLRLE